MSASRAEPLVSVAALHKYYGAIEVLKGVDVSFRAGEIHAFLGANGAGKSTFLGCLSGAVTPSNGRIQIGDEGYTSLTPRRAIDAGIGIIYQHSQVFEGLTVADNIFLGREYRRMGVIDRVKQNRGAVDLLSRLKVEIDPNAALEHLGTGERKIVEIARALNLNPRLLILDEPTAALGESEMRVLHDVVRQLAENEGIAVVYVTHLLDEIEEIADVVTILRDGRIVWTKPKAETNAAILAEAIAPSARRSSAQISAAPATAEPVLHLREFRSPFTGPINLSLCRGEAIGVYGLLGSGRTDLIETLFGARQMRDGEMVFNDQPVRFRSTSDALRAGVSLVASDRTEQSIFGALSATDNLLMPYFGTKLLPGVARNQKRERALFQNIATQLDVRPADPDLEIRHFSGGNAQKIVLGRWLIDKSREGSLILLDEPTQGVDVGARTQLYDTLRDLMNKGTSIIFTSSDPDEIIELADRVLILAYGRQIALIDNPHSERTLIEYAHRTQTAVNVHA